MRSMRSMRGGFIFRNRGPSLKVADRKLSHWKKGDDCQPGARGMSARRVGCREGLNRSSGGFYALYAWWCLAASGRQLLPGVTPAMALEVSAFYAFCTFHA